MELIHHVMKNIKNKPVVLQIYDYAQMFDAINLKEAISDIFDTGFKDDALSLVNTPSGLSERQTRHQQVA